ncbi:MAG: hypothetical protein JXQ72_10690 [Anaerolineae bacterium]|nr:hypothetical protein [Anaerolineae bacterium]
MSDDIFPDDDLPENGDPDDDIAYVDFDEIDGGWEEPADEENAIDLDVIDLDALDDAIPAEGDEGGESEPAAVDAALLDTLDELDDALDDELDDESEPELEPEPAPPAESRLIWEPPPEPGDTVPIPELQAELASLYAVSEAEAEIEESDEEPESEPEPEPAAEPGDTEEAEDESPAVPQDVYRVLLPLPPDLTAQVLELRAMGGIVHMPPPGITLLSAFRTTDRSAVEAAIRAWAKTQLPFRLEITGVLAEVIGAQQYVAAWTLDPEDALQEAQYALMRALLPVILPLPDPTGMPISALPVRVTVGDRIAARHYPEVIGQMQRDFESVLWTVSTVQIAHHEPGAPPDEWTVLE